MDQGNVLLADIAGRNNEAIQIDSTLRELIRMMEKNRRGAVVVLRGEKPVGILTERDVVKLLFEGIDLDGKTERYVRRPLILSDGSRSIGYALNLMVENDIRRVVVVDRAGDYLGLVTQNDLLKHLEEDYYRSTLKVKHVIDQLKLLISASRHDTIGDVLKKMVVNKISAVPILEGGEPLGIITEKDILKLANRSVPLHEQVSMYMSFPVVCADLETNLVDIVKTMNAGNISRVVIKNPLGIAIAMVTNRDLIRNLEGNYNEFLEKKLRNIKEFLNLLPEMLMELIDTGDSQLVVWGNEKLLNRFGREIVGKPVTDLVPQKTWEEIFGFLQEQDKIDDVRFKKDDSVYECSGFHMHTANPREKGRIQLILRDITQDVQMSTIDPLTGVHNKRFMTEFLSREAERSHRTKKNFAIVLVDLDNFGQVNEKYGESSGDSVLKEIAAVIRRGTRSFDLVGRYGGEEFLIIIPEIAAKQTAVDVAERIRRSIASHVCFFPAGEKFSMTASFGVACMGEDGTSPEDLLVKVGERMFRAKREGRNRVVHA
jgi:diguanylate cyclase (GGDEF)-like protein